MAKGKNGLVYLVAALTMPVAASGVIAVNNKCRDQHTDTTKIYNEYTNDNQSIIGKQVGMNYGALIYPGPDNAIYGKDAKEPYFSLDKKRTVVAAVYEIQNDFEIVNDCSQEINVINNGGELVAVQTKVDGEVEGYFRIEALHIKENGKVHKIGT